METIPPKKTYERAILRAPESLKIQRPLMILFAGSMLLMFLHHQMVAIWLQEQLQAHQKQIDANTEALQKGRLQLLRQQATIDKLSEQLQEEKNRRQMLLYGGQQEQKYKSPENAGFQFPSVHERIQYYMGDWYQNVKEGTTPPQNLVSKNWCDTVEYFDVKKHKPCCRPYLFDEHNLKDHPMKMYAEDVLKYVVNTLPLRWSDETADTKISDTRDLSNSKFLAAMYFGDIRTNPKSNVPVIVKSRHINETKSIIFPMNVIRHFDVMKTVPEIDHPWENKTSDGIVWRGDNTGKGHGLRLRTVEMYQKFPEGSEIDIGLVPGQAPGRSHLERRKVTRRNMLKKKYLLSMEGNDVASDLKWMLYSNSVVFMAPPTSVSWAMEDRLVPFYHYIPLNKDLSNLKEMLEWARKNDKKCQEISRHATEFMEQVWASDEAQRNNAYILSEMAATYSTLYGKAFAKCKK